jgi:glutamyl-tRNA synthetase
LSRGYRERGYYPDAFVNMLALLGWNPGTDQEIMDMEELVRTFDLERVHKGGAKFDPDKTKWFNQQYLRMRSDVELGSQLRDMLAEKGIDTTLEKASLAAHLLKERATFPEDMLEGMYLFTTGSPIADPVINLDITNAMDELKKRWSPQSGAAMETFVKKLAAMDALVPECIEAAFNEVLQEHTLKIGQLMPLYRLFVAGRMQGPGMFQVSALLGKEEVLNRIGSGLSVCAQWA